MTDEGVDVALCLTCFAYQQLWLTHLSSGAAAERTAGGVGVGHMASLWALTRMIMVMMMCIQVEVQELKEQLDMLELVMLLGPLSTKRRRRRRIMVMMMCIQVEVQELKEQLNMLESATSLGALSINPHGSAFTDDSITDLGIRKTLNFSTPDSTTRLDQKWFIGHSILFACKGKVEQTDIQMSCTCPVLFVRVSTLYMSCFVCVSVHPVHVLFCLCQCPPWTCPVLPVSVSTLYMSCFVLSCFFLPSPLALSVLSYFCYWSILLPFFSRKLSK